LELSGERKHMTTTLFPREQYQMLQAMRERLAYRDMAFTMQEALKLIAGGDGDAQRIAQQTLDQLNKEYGDEFGRPGQDVHSCPI
jgi:hypothetical protein